MLKLAPAAASGADTSPRLSSYARDAPREAAAEAFCGAASHSCLPAWSHLVAHSFMLALRWYKKLGRKGSFYCERARNGTGQAAVRPWRRPGAPLGAALLPDGSLVLALVAWCPSACRRLLFRWHAHFLRCHLTSGRCYL